MESEEIPLLADFKQLVYEIMKFIKSFYHDYFEAKELNIKRLFWVNTQQIRNFINLCIKRDLIKKRKLYPSEQ